MWNFTIFSRDFYCVSIGKSWKRIWIFVFVKIFVSVITRTSVPIKYVLTALSKNSSFMKIRVLLLIMNNNEIKLLFRYYGFSSSL